ncbi:hypothetical protein EUGRSUZ_C01108 [Eucalyptus grandis]|uniref:Uncharacterized protein n=2 Tax=Eucalyptus grandis TaxID=71139 RepID=A0ACC3LC30_EUCGR|nr:hypothetical protein EUGRSUZ_C01108 [Eucalyptus grandis]
MLTWSGPAGLQIGPVPEVRSQAGGDRGVIHGVVAGGRIGGHEPEEPRLLLREPDRVGARPPRRGQARARALQVGLPGVGDLAAAAAGGVNVARVGGEAEDRGQPIVVGGGGGGGLDGEGSGGKEAGGHYGGGEIESDVRWRWRAEVVLSTA